MVAFACKCGKKYEVDDKLAGRHVKCPSCHEVILVPERPAADGDPSAGHGGKVGPLDFRTRQRLTVRETLRRYMRLRCSRRRMPKLPATAETEQSP